MKVNWSSHCPPITLFTLITPVVSFAHGGSHVDSSRFWWTLWSFDPLIVLNLSLLAIVYARGWVGMKKRRSERFQASIWSAAAFVVGWFFLILSLVSPLDTMSESLGWVHMIQHTVLMMIAAPLLVLARPGHMAQWGLPARFWQQFVRLKSRIWKPVRTRMRIPGAWLVWVLFSCTLWLWHVPAMYQAALLDPWIHDVQHLAFFVTAFFFWKVVIDTTSSRPLHPGVGIIYLFLASLHSMTLGILMAFSPFVFYPAYEDRSIRFGISALEDQQIAGYIMWMPAGVTYIVAAIALLIRLLKWSEQNWGEPVAHLQERFEIDKKSSREKEHRAIAPR